MSDAPRRGGDPRLPKRGKPSNVAVFVLLVITMLLLMTFSIVLWLVGNTALAAVSGSTAVGLGGEVVRRFLGLLDGGQGNPPADSPTSPTLPYSG